MDREFGYRIRVLHLCTEQVMTEALTQMDLTASQGHIMGFLCRQTENLCARDVEHHFRLSHPTVSGLLARLEKKGFIAFFTDEQDKRCKRIRVLPKGMEGHHRIVEAIRQNEERMMAGFSGEARSLFSAFLDRAIANVGGCPCNHNSEEETQT